jgi:hypothetical protein
MPRIPTNWKPGKPVKSVTPVKRTVICGTPRLEQAKNVVAQAPWELPPAGKLKSRVLKDLHQPHTRKPHFRD